MTGISRRNVLKGLAGTVSLGGVTTVVGAQESGPPDLETITFIFRRRERPPNAGPPDDDGGGDSGCEGGDQYSLIRGGIHWPQDTVKYHNQTSYGTAVDAAFSTWSGTAAPSLAPDSNADNTVTMASLSSGTLAVARLSFNPATKEIHECDIEMNSKVTWSTDGATSECEFPASHFDVQNVMTHEVGHFIGLDHVNDEYLTLYGYASEGETRKCSLGPGDQAGATALYG